jgi:pimeloyl-ACP methyl ester carboxylesterase
MPQFERETTTIYYEEHGSGFPLLLLGPGGMLSSIAVWGRAAINPLDLYGDEFRLIAMDQRNAGRSTGPLEVDDPWGCYAGDQLALLDYLGVDTFHVMGCCIGGSFILKLLQQTPSRVVASVLEQPIGITDDNAVLFEQMWRSWGTHLAESRPDIDASVVVEFGRKMWDGGEFVVSVSKDFVRTCTSPILVLPGTDEYHPTAIGHEIATLAPGGEIFEPWNDTPEHVAQGVEAVRQFLQHNTPQYS